MAIAHGGCDVNVFISHELDSSILFYILILSNDGFLLKRTSNAIAFETINLAQVLDCISKTSNSLCMTVG